MEKLFSTHLLKGSVYTNRIEHIFFFTSSGILSFVLCVDFMQYLPLCCHPKYNCGEWNFIGGAQSSEK